MSKTNQSDFDSEIKNKAAIMVLVRTNSRKTRIVSYDSVRQAYIMDIAAPPQDGKANDKLIKHLSKITGREAKIISGATSKKKLIRFS